MIFASPLLAAIGPFLLWPIELFLPYPFVLEEIFKGVLVYLILGSGVRRTQEKLIILSALLFSFSESVMYIINIFLVGNTNTCLLYTSPSPRD